MTQEVLHGVAVGDLFHGTAGQAIEVGQGRGTVQFIVQLPAGAQLQQEGQGRRPEQELAGKGDLVLVAAVAQLSQPLR